MYYRIMGKDGNPYASGLNCTSLEDVKEQWVDLNLDQVDDDEDRETYADRDLHELLEAQDAYLEESETRFYDPDNDDETEFFE